MSLILFCLGMFIVGTGVGVLSAGLGMGGGVLMVPAFVEFVNLDPHTAKGTSLFVIVFVAALNAWRLNRDQHDTPWRLAGMLAPGAVVGGYFGGWATTLMSGSTVLWLFVGALGLLGLRTFFIDLELVSAEDVRRRDGVAVLVGVVSGIVGGATGTGGGLVLVPLALLAGLTTNDRVVGLSNMVMVATSAAASAAHLNAERISSLPGTVGQVSLALVPLVFLGAQLGSRWGTRLNVLLTLRRRRIVMGALLIIIAWRVACRALIS